MENTLSSDALTPYEFSLFRSISCSPIRVALLFSLLSSFPNQEIVHSVCLGLHFGFDIGFSGEACNSRPPNLRSAIKFFRSVSAQVAAEVSRGHTLGPFSCPPFINFHCSPLGAVPKPNGSVRLILDLSSPRGSSINEGIDQDHYSVRYCSFDEAVDRIRGLGPSAYLAKVDIKHAFRLCPVLPQQWHLLGFSWDNRFYFDMRLPFGSRSSPALFNDFADLLAWILVQNGLEGLLHYDDFLISTRGRASCLQQLDTLLDFFRWLGIPVAIEKTVGPAQILIFLGIEIDVVARIIRLPADKFRELQVNLQRWALKRKCTKRELLSLIGSLSFACKVVKPGRIFLRRLIDLSTTVSSLHHHIDLNLEARADISWWVDCVQFWHGRSFFQDDVVSSDALELYTDASALGLGGVYGAQWFSTPLTDELSLAFRQDVIDIAYLELLAIVAATFTWGAHWVNKQILFFTDNSSICHIWSSGSSRNKYIMCLVRALFATAARFNINILFQHVPGSKNVLADRLSRLDVAGFRRLNPGAATEPSQVDPRIWTLLTL